ncbi:acetyl-CoA carboxylase biotin carboxylase subunit [Frigoribacterium faeni]|uniref:biotin carboxylase n=1 Tax=Frigoribacterium faeni TaxID=145483 RepID=A0A7W3JHN7_9MICO|nr:biotin carboxylase N-terminal domain-containing protein [Frigoribacterium faeni]MBA8813039.1 acetyl-CoA/propionyl-CoA carboxylase biotin carboxyl carrier protein [Frigoribacterium faeni]GEK84707.1 acetyl/propionyl-CoA carboxylase subuit alpha [Frigoribacterium faeni]
MKKVLIAERGEIAVRIAGACAELELGSVSVYADDDADALHVTSADEAWALPTGGAVDPYLDMDALVDVAQRSGADTVHPGCGPLSENAEFARRVVAAGLTWVGPDPETMEVLGDKIAARALADSVGAALVVGTAGPIDTADEAVAFAQKHGLPIALKAAHGGGGLGLRVARRLDEVSDLFDSAVREAVAVFGRGECFVEQYLDRPRHVEAQLLGDGRGGIVVIDVRDCSVQRRHQKLVAESPAPFLTGEQIETVVDTARSIAAAVSYRGAGTVEFLVSRSGVVSFLEFGTALAVEHASTEQTTGVDLVRHQLLIADDRPIEAVDRPSPRGHSLTFRVTAEDPGRGFLPAPAVVSALALPGGPGVRIDSGVVVGGAVPAGRDSLLLTVTVTGRDRDGAIRRARRCLTALTVEGPATSLPFHRLLLDEPAFTAPEGRTGVHTRWIETELDGLELLAVPTPGSPRATATLRTWVEVDGRRVAIGLPAAVTTADVVAALTAAVVAPEA